MPTATSTWTPETNTWDPREGHQGSVRRLLLSSRLPLLALPRFLAILSICFQQSLQSVRGGCGRRRVGAGDGVNLQAM